MLVRGPGESFNGSRMVSISLDRHIRGGVPYQKLEGGGEEGRKEREGGRKEGEGGRRNKEQQFKENYLKFVTFFSDISF